MFFKKLVFLVALLATTFPTLVGGQGVATIIEQQLTQSDDPVVFGGGRTVRVTFSNPSTNSGRVQFFIDLSPLPGQGNVLSFEFQDEIYPSTLKAGAWAAFILAPGETRTVTVFAKIQCSSDDVCITTPETVTEGFLSTAVMGTSDQLKQIKVPLIDTSVCVSGIKSNVLHPMPVTAGCPLTYYADVPVVLPTPSRRRQYR